MNEQRRVLEEQLRACHNAGDYTAFVTQLIRGYGPELNSFLGSLLRDDNQRSEVFSALCEDIWKGAPSFRYACSARTWCYTLARHAALRSRRQCGRHAHARISFAELPSHAEIEAEIRSSTAHYLRSDFKDRARQLRDRLSEEDRLMLGLRLERGLAWREIACILSNAPSPLCEEELEVVATRLRQRMTVLKAKLRDMARQQGWLAERERVPRQPSR